MTLVRTIGKAGEIPGKSNNTAIGQSFIVDVVEATVAEITSTITVANITITCAASAVVRLAGSDIYKLRTKLVAVAVAPGGSIVVATNLAEGNFYAVRIA